MLPVEPVKSSNSSFVFAFMGVNFMGLLLDIHNIDLFAVPYNLCIWL